MCDSLSPVSADISFSQPEPDRKGAAADAQQEVRFRLLKLYSVRRDCYWPQLCSDGSLISTDLLLTGGFLTGMKLGEDPDLFIVFLDERGRAFAGRYGGHRPWRVVTFFARSFVRLRLFSLWFSWQRLHDVQMSDCRPNVVIAVTDSEGCRHYLAFPVADSIRKHFPYFSTEVS